MSVMTAESSRALWMVFPRAERSCGCGAGEMCSRCRCVALAGAETVVDGISARYNLKHGSVRVQSPPRVLRYRPGTPTGETVAGDCWTGTMAQFQRVHSKEFVDLCMVGWFTALAEAQER